MTFRPKVLAWLAASSLVLVGSVATAASDPVIDQKAGSLGRVIGIRIVTPGSRDHASYHGFVRTKPPLGDPETYYWGGSSCPKSNSGASTFCPTTSSTTWPTN